jgi:hypothetical protein
VESGATWPASTSSLEIVGKALQQSRSDLSNEERKCVEVLYQRERAEEVRRPADIDGKSGP